MLSDLIASFATSLSSPHRALGYLDEALDMRRRARINRAAWQPHLDRTRSFVLASAERCGNKGTAVILGSGLLLDVPLPELSEQFSNVVLKDVVCLPEIRRQIAAYRNVTFVEHDVTGLALRLSENSRQGVPQLPEPSALRSREEDDAGLTVSLNILSQLWVVPRAFIGRRMPQLDPGQVDDWCAGIVEAHAAWLRSLPGDICLVADHEAVRRDSRGNIVSRSSTVFGLDLPPPAETWTWSIAPLGKENPHTSKELIVGAWHALPDLITPHFREAGGEAS